jgi:hypothetical protein
MKVLFVLMLAVFPVQANVLISSPTNGTTVSSPVKLAATSSQSGSTMSVYVDNVFVSQSKTSSISTTLAMAAGTHSIRVSAQASRRGSSSATVTIIVGGSPSGGESVAEQIYDDMAGVNEGHPHGVPSSYDFYNGPVIGEGNNIAPNAAIEWWAALYVGPNGNQSTNTWVNVKNLQLWTLSRSTGVWTEQMNVNAPEGSDYFSEDFTTDYNTPVVSKTQSDGTWSLVTVSGKVGHFYAPFPRISVNPTDLAGVVAIIEARLILDNPNGTNDMANASFLLGVGADPYPTTTGPGIENNPSIGGGKFKYVTANWRSFCMTTMSLAQLESNPPPINLTGILP